jgi:formylglycine-generating enzyme required for sulfatase activity
MVYYEQNRMQTFNIFKDIPCSEMIKIPEGDFIMGDNNSGWDREKPEHPVHVPSFYIGKYPVTQALWQKVMGNNPSRFKGKNRPVEQVSWNDITEIFLPKLNKITSLGGKSRLPTEAEWEYAAHGNVGTGDALSTHTNAQNTKYAGSNNLEEVGWYNENSHYETKPVGLKNPNKFDLYDMSGNVSEWCEDQWHDNYKNAPDDGTAWITDTPDKSLYRVLRGGSYFYDSGYCRSSSRISIDPSFRLNDVGFRLVFQVQ